MLQNNDINIYGTINFEVFSLNNVSY